jgi:long-chain acyl-CoA synthetase
LYRRIPLEFYVMSQNSTTGPHGDAKQKSDESALSERREPGAPLWVVGTVGLIKLVTFLYELVSWPIYSLFSSGEPTMDDQGPMLACPTKDDDPSSPWRCLESLNDQRLAHTMFPGCSTLDDLWDRAVRLWPQAKIIGTRPLLKVELEAQANGRKFKKLSQGPYHFHTFTELTERINGIAYGFLRHLNLRPREDRVIIFAETRMEWMLTAQACFRSGIPLVTLYSTLGDDALVHGVDESEVRVILTSDELLDKVIKLLPRMPNIRHVIYMRDPALISNPVEGDEFKLPNANKLPSGVELISMSELETQGLKYSDDEEAIKKAKPAREDLAVIMYTSGSTGAPKGVEITHANLMCSLAGQAHRLPVISNKDRYIAYLPLAHVLELCAELVLICNCVPVGYGAPLTLLDNSNKVKRGTKGDVSALRPTLMACVPTIIDRLHKTVSEIVTDAGPLVREFFKWALQFKTRRLTYGFHSVLMDRIIFRRIRKILGGKVRFMLSGGAPLVWKVKNSSMLAFVE